MLSNSKFQRNNSKDGSDEEFLKFIKEFSNHVNTYKIWGDEHAVHTLSKNFQRCLAGAAARDLGNQIKVLEDKDGGREYTTFQFHGKN